MAFRARDAANGYLFVMDQKEGFKKLLRVEDDSVTTLAQREDGGYLPGKWSSVRIETSHGRIDVSVGEDGSAPTELFR